MTDMARTELTITVYLTPAQIAAAFCELDDDAQARCIVEIARIMRAWDRPGAFDFQTHAIGRHLATCECSTEDARDFVRYVYWAIEPEAVK